MLELMVAGWSRRGGRRYVMLNAPRGGARGDPCAAPRALAPRRCSSSPSRGRSRSMPRSTPTRSGTCWRPLEGSGRLVDPRGAGGAARPVRGEQPSRTSCRALPRSWRTSRERGDAAVLDWTERLDGERPELAGAAGAASRGSPGAGGPRRSCGRSRMRSPCSASSNGRRTSALEGRVAGVQRRAALDSRFSSVGCLCSRRPLLLAEQGDRIRERPHCGEGLRLQASRAKLLRRAPAARAARRPGAQSSRALLVAALRGRPPRSRQHAAGPPRGLAPLTRRAAPRADRGSTRRPPPSRRQRVQMSSASTAA